MNERRYALVVGSQCRTLGKDMHLEFLPRLANDLHAVITDPDLGAFAPALPGESRGLILNPTCEAFLQALEGAFETADQPGVPSTLFVAIIGHGLAKGDDFYFLPKDARATGRTRYDINLSQHLKELLRDHQDVEGLIVWMDTCQAGTGAIEAARECIQLVLTESTRAFALLTATDGNPAYDGEYTTLLVDRLKDGIVGAPPRITASELQKYTEPELSQSQRVEFDGRGGSAPLWIAYNKELRGKEDDRAGKAAVALASNLTRYLQPTPVLGALVERTTEAPCVVLTGYKGEGKSTLAAALTQPTTTHTVAGDHFVHAIAFGDRCPYQGMLARALAGQLRDTVEDFSGAVYQLEQEYAGETGQRNPLEHKVFGPLRRLSLEGSVRLVIDAFDQLLPETQAHIRGVIRTGNADAAGQRPPDAPEVRFVLTSRPKTIRPRPHKATFLEIASPGDDAIAAYFRLRGIAETHVPRLVAKAAGNWLFAHMIAEHAERTGLESSYLSHEGALSYKEVFDLELDTAVRRHNHDWDALLGPVLAVCAAAGVNPRLPRPIASAAAERYAGHPPGTYTDTQFQKALDALSSLIVNSQPDDLLGIFHVSLLEDYFYKPERSENYPVNLPDAHRAIVDALRELAPADQHDPSNELHRYAMEWEPDHLWKCGRVDEIEKIVESLEARPLAKAADERERWQRWATALGEKLDKQSTAVVTARENLARWTGEAGNPTRAQAELTKLLPVRDQISGPDSEATIRTRGRIAYYTAKVGDMADASKLYGELWALCQGRLGDVHPTTLETWTDYARFTGEAGRPEHARKELRELLHICQNKSGETFGKDGTRTIAVAENLARFTGEAGFPRSARRQYARVLPFRQRASGPTDPDTLITRSNLAYFIGEAGEPGEACARYTELLPIREKTGKKHPDTLTTRANLARFMGEAGEPIAALKELTDLLALREKMAHQAHHPDTLTTWEILARLTAQLGRPATAVEALIGVLPRRARTSGDRHPDTIATRTNLACFTGMAAEPVGTYYDPEEAADELTEVSAMTNRQAADNPLLEPSMHTAELSVDVEKRTSAPEHPDTLTIRAPLAQMNALSRQPTAHMSGNEKLFETVERLKDLLSARVAASGKDHPDTLTTRENLAYFTGIAGNAAAAVDELTAVLRRRVRVLGPDHPATLVTRANIAYFTRAAGDVAAAVQQLSDLLQPRLRVSGQSHPDTLAVRRFLGHWADVATEPPRAWTPGASALPV